jgi:hypothetical protein
MKDKKLTAIGGQLVWLKLTEAIEALAVFAGEKG